MSTQTVERLPRLRDDVRISDATWHGAKSVHLVRDPVAGRTFEVGAKEHFVMTRLDGSHSRETICASYADRFGRRLDDRGFGQLMALLGGRRLLDAGQPAGQTDGRTGAAVDIDTDTSARRNSWLAAELMLSRNPQAFTERIGHRFAALGGRRGAVLAALITVGAGVAAVLPSASIGQRLAGAVSSWSSVLIAVLVIWLITAAHELAHGVVAALQGGRVTGYGIRWRMPVAIPFCRVDDYLFLAGRGGRVAAALAGPAVHLLAAGGCAAIWLLAPVDATAADVLALVWVANLVLTVANLVPLAPLDGYVALSHATGVLQLTAQSQRFVATRVRAVFRPDDEQVRDELAAYPTRLRRLYLAYALAAPVLVIVLAVGIVLAVAHALPHEAGAWRYAGPAAGVLLAIAGMAATQRNRSETR